jgi:hypothetical protein
MALSDKVVLTSGSEGASEESVKRSLEGHGHELAEHLPERGRSRDQPGTARVGRAVRVLLNLAHNSARYRGKRGEACASTPGVESGWRHSSGTALKRNDLLLL